MKRLQATLLANIPAWDGNTAAIEDTIKRREELAFSDDDLRESFGRLVAATHDQAQAFNLQNTAMDLARFKGIDLQSATEELVRVQAGQYRSLKSLGIVIDANATSEQALAEVHKVTAGQAQAFGDTTAGAMQAATIAVHDLQEEIGTKLAPAVKNAANFLRTDLIPAIGEVIGALDAGSTEVNDFKKNLQDFYNEEIHTQKESKGLAAAVKEAQAATTSAGEAAADTAEAINKTGIAQTYVTGTALAAAEAAEKHRLRLLGEADASDTSRSAVNQLGAALDGLPRDISVNIDVGLSGVGAGLLSKGVAQTLTPAGNTDFGPTHSSTGSLDGTNGDPVARARARAEAAREAQRAADEAGRKAQQAQDEAARKAKQAADAHARAIKEQTAEAYRLATTAAQKFFEAEHQFNLKAIDDARDKANAIIDADERAANKHVSDEEKKLQAQRDAQHEIDLRADVASATNALGAETDPKKKAGEQQDLDRAKRALNDFLADQRIAFLNDQAATTIAADEAQKTANDAAASDKTTAENARAQAEENKLNVTLTTNLVAKLVLADGRVLADLVTEYQQTGGVKYKPVKPKTGSKR